MVMGMAALLHREGGPTAVHTFSIGSHHADENAQSD